MEHLAESISIFATPNLGVVTSIVTDAQIEGDKAPGRKFLRVFQEYNAEHRPDIVCLVEPRVSGTKANIIIEKLGFNHSHRVEAVGFSGGIWDLGFNGPAFTWQKGGTFVRLDRPLANDAWVSALSFFQGRPFRFLAGWMKHGDFSNLVKEKWNFAGNTFDSLNNFTSFAKDWNRNIYGFLGTRKRNLMRSLNNIQKTLEHSSSTYLSGKELEIRDELENVLDHEDLLWRQKARCDWLQLGDRNTNFFHSRTLKRRKFNRITTLRIDNGDWCTDQDILQAKAVDFFE
ncbi:hypothetical protein Gotri_027036 [Gossypium trilobum]|uniref:Reverse transcriptase n=1 Tax=Gossypium trilobum TaxID=34281 RepID=A0A7J9FJZ2_9ROSI|nr:hypothetical protein [Gossypium trilobum]